MSYILDALKKSEKERQRGSVPDVLTPQDAVAGQKRKRRLLPYLVLGVLILSAGLLVGWLIGSPKKPQAVTQSDAPRQVQTNAPKLAKDTHTAHASIEASSAEPVTTGSSLIRATEKRPAARTETTAKRETLNPPPAVYQEQAQGTVSDQKKGKEDRPSPPSVPKVTREAPPAAPQQAVVNRAPAEPQPVTHIEPPIKNKLYSLKELPASLQQNLPDFSISTHLYAADTNSRMVRINGQMLREGQYLSADLKLEEIIPDGVIFSFQNYRFRVGLNK